MMKPPMNPRAAGRRRFLRGSLGLACVVAAADTGAAATRAALPERMAGPVAGGWRRHTLALGTRVSVTVAGLPPPQADAAAQAALAEIRRVEAAASLFNGSALLSRLNRAGELTTDDPHLMRLLQAADHWWQASGGAFDATDAGKLEVHEYNIGLRFGKEPRSVLAPIRLADDFQVVLKLQRGHEAAADDKVIVDEEEGDHGGMSNE